MASVPWLPQGGAASTWRGDVLPAHWVGNTLRRVTSPSRMKLYEGVRTESGCRVTAGGAPLNLRNDLRDHSPTGAEWGYGGSGPAQLALALLADATGDDELAQAHYQRFKREVVAGFERDRFLITQAKIRCWIAAVLAEPDAS